MMERTLMLVKPEGVKRALIGRIISRMEDSGLKVVAIKMVVPDSKTAGVHYIADKKWLNDTGSRTIQAYRDKGVVIKETPVQVATRIRNLLIKSLAGNPVVAIVFEGNEAAFVARKITGSTEPRKADPSTIRGLFSTDSYELSDSIGRPIRNIVHASEDAKTAKREIGVWFSPKELIQYKRADEDALY
ncbi:MAG: nucleoside-diphosphate kinase [Candidatus Micrarchaeaceae archaeon]